MSDMTPTDRLVTAAIVGGVASSASEYLMAKYGVAGMTKPDPTAFVRGAVAAIIASIYFSKKP